MLSLLLGFPPTVASLGRPAAQLVVVRLKARWEEEVFFSASAGVGAVGIGGGAGCWEAGWWAGRVGLAR